MYTDVLFHKSAFPNVVQQMALETSIAIAAGLAVAAGVQREEDDSFHGSRSSWSFWNYIM